jgi:hypothetical protein
MSCPSKSIIVSTHLFPKMLEAEPVIDVVDSTLSIAVELFPINL